MRRIADRVWRAGTGLPGEDKLADEFCVSVGTIRKVVQGLVHEGVLERKHGKGTFLTSPYERNSILRFVRFTNCGPGRLPTAKILQLEIQEANPLVADGLQIKSGSKVIYLHRTRIAKDKVILVEHIWLPHTFFSKLVTYL